MISIFNASKKKCIDRAIGAPGHGKDLVDGLNVCDKQHLKRYMKHINNQHEGDKDKNIKPYLIYKKYIFSLDDECRRHCLEGQEFGSKGGIKHKKESKIQQSGKDTIMWQMLMKK